MIPSSSLAPRFNASFMVTFMPQEVYGNMAEHRESLCPFVFANPAGIFIKGHIENPMERILNAPVLSYGLREPHPLRRQRKYRVSLCTFSPIARHDSTIPILCNLAQEVFAPSDSIAEVIQYRRVSIRP